MCHVAKCYTLLQICYAILKMCSNFITMHFSVKVCHFQQMEFLQQIAIHLFPRKWITEDKNIRKCKNKKQKQNMASLLEAILIYSKIMLLASLSCMEALFLGVTSDVLKIVHSNFRMRRLINTVI